MDSQDQPVRTGEPESGRTGEREHRSRTVHCAVPCSAVQCTHASECCTSFQLPRDRFSPKGHPPNDLSSRRLCSIQSDRSESRWLRRGSLIDIRAPTSAFGRCAPTMDTDSMPTGISATRPRGSESWGRAGFRVCSCLAGLRNLLGRERIRPPRVALSRVSGLEFPGFERGRRQAESSMLPARKHSRNSATRSRAKAQSTRRILLF